MRYSKLLGKTLRQSSKSSEGTGLGNLQRAGMIKSAAGGTYTLLPLGARVMDKLCRMAQAEFVAAGAQNIVLPPYAPTFKEQSSLADQRRELASRRRESRLRYLFAASHEETLAALAGSLTLSYRELPIVVAQQQWKFSEAGRWFLMQGAYSFDAGDDSESRLADACRGLFEKTGIPVFAMDSAEGVEFAVLSTSGEETFAVCEACGYHAHWDRAEALAAEFAQSEEPLPVQSIFGPGIISTAELAQFAGIPQQKTTKALLFVADGRNVAVCVRGEFDVSEAKVKTLLGCSSLELAAPELVRDLTGAEVGYAGPIGLRGDVEVIWDLSTEGRINFEAGANKTDYHLINLNFGCDVAAPARFADVRQAREGERCARCKDGTIHARSGDRVAHVTSTGELYSKALGASFAAREGGSTPLRIDCCGVDLTRLLVAAAEHHVDARGLRWPAALAPFEAHLITLGAADERAGEVYHRLRESGIDVLWDERSAPAGAKFSDADLIGIPVRLVVSPKTGEQVEWKERGSESAVLRPLDEVIGEIGD